MRPMGRHPGEETLALLAGNDLPLLERWVVSAHVRNCEDCSRLVAEYKRLRLETAALAEEMEGEQWARLEAEMRANIRLGLAAGEAVESGISEPPRGAFNWRWVAVTASLAFVFGAGSWLELRSRDSSPVQTASLTQPVVEAGSGGLSLRNTEASLELIRPRGSAAVRTVSWDGSAGARYFDGDTGQVTIHRVAWEESDAR